MIVKTRKLSTTAETIRNTYDTVSDSAQQYRLSLTLINHEYDLRKFYSRITEL